MHRAEEGRSQIEFQRVWVEGELKGLVTGEQLQQVEEQMVALVKQVEARQAELEWQSRLEQENCVVELQQGEERLCDVWSVGQVEARMSAAVKEQVSRLEQEGCVVVASVKQVEERLREVQERPDMTERIESIEKSMQVCVNSVRVLHSYAEANDSTDSDSEGT